MADAVTAALNPLARELAGSIFSHFLKISLFDIITLIVLHLFGVF